MRKLNIQNFFVNLSFKNLIGKSSQGRLFKEQNKFTKSNAKFSTKTTENIKLNDVYIDQR
jgi:hypothetical protein